MPEALAPVTSMRPGSKGFCDQGRLSSGATEVLRDLCGGVPEVGRVEVEHKDASFLPHILYIIYSLIHF